ncbi:MAG TPA: hypothetical protein VF733_06380 [Candidatus Saccharimonadales bacterium]
MEKNPHNSSEDDNSTSGKPKKSIESYFRAFVPPPEAMQRPFETSVPERRPVPLIPHEGILLFDRDQEPTKKDSKSEKSEIVTTDGDESEETSSKKNKKTANAAPPQKRIFRPVIPHGALGSEAFPSAEALAKAAAAKEREQAAKRGGDNELAGNMDPTLPQAEAIDTTPHSGVSSGSEFQPSAAFSHEMPSHDTFGDLPVIEDHHKDPPFPQMAMSPVYAQSSNHNVMSGDLFEHQAEHSIEDTDDPQTVFAPLQGTQPNFVPPSPNQQAATANQVPHYAYYAPNTPPPNPGGGAQPPLPPRPPTGGIGGNTSGGNMPPINPNTTYFGSGAPGPSPNTLGSAPNIAAPGIATANTLRTKNADPLARLMGLGNWIGNRRTRKKLGGRINQLQGQTAKNMGEMQNRQNYLERQQQQQLQEMQQLKKRQENAAAVGVSGGAERSVVIPTQRVEGAGRALAGPNTLPARGSENRLAGAAIAEQQELAAQAAADQDIKQVDNKWFRTDIRRSTGEVVSDSRDYGEGFQRERQQEIIRSRLGSSKAAAGMVGLMGAQQGQYNSTDSQQPYSTLGSGMTTPGLPQGMPTHIDPQHQLAADNKKSSIIPGPAFWIMLIIIIAAFFAAALI